MTNPLKHQVFNALYSMFDVRYELKHYRTPFMVLEQRLSDAEEDLGYAGATEMEHPELFTKITPARLLVDQWNADPTLTENAKSFRAQKIDLEFLPLESSPEGIILKGLIDIALAGAKNFLSDLEIEAMTEPALLAQQNELVAKERRLAALPQLLIDKARSYREVNSLTLSGTPDEQRTTKAGLRHNILAEQTRMRIEKTRLEAEIPILRSAIEDARNLVVRHLQMATTNNTQPIHWA